mmetsp:Transcript_57743/g.162875  ORF Transcript_57743/g.162875 Transcript_57743/m.162875 type:complete len:215 (+) Transcript_57743:672-1316(+)
MRGAWRQRAKSHDRSGRSDPGPVRRKQGRERVQAQAARGLPQLLEHPRPREGAVDVAGRRAPRQVGVRQLRQQRRRDPRPRRVREGGREAPRGPAAGCQHEGRPPEGDRRVELVGRRRERLRLHRLQGVPEVVFVERFQRGPAAHGRSARFAQHCQAERRQRRLCGAHQALLRLLRRRPLGRRGHARVRADPLQGPEDTPPPRAAREPRAVLLV